MSESVVTFPITAYIPPTVIEDVLKGMDDELSLTDRITAGLLAYIDDYDLYDASQQAELDALNKDICRKVGLV